MIFFTSVVDFHQPAAENAWQQQTIHCDLLNKNACLHFV